MNRKVSVIVPAYNRENLIDETIESVLNQTYTNFELIIVDDGSTDHTKEVVMSFRDKRIHYFYQENSGLPACARNKGIFLAKGDYIAFLDSDDLWVPERLAIQLDTLECKPNVGLICSDAKIFGSTKKRKTSTIWENAVPPSGWVFHSLYLWNFICTSTVLCRREVFDNVGHFDERLQFQFVEDYHMWLRIASRYEVISLNKPLAFYRMHEGYGSSNITKRLSSLITVLADIRHLCPEQVGAFERCASKRMAGTHIELGRVFLKNGKIDQACEEFVRSLKLYPFSIRALGHYTLSIMPNPMINKLILARKRFKEM